MKLNQTSFLRPTSIIRYSLALLFILHQSLQEGNQGLSRAFASLYDKFIKEILAA